MALPHHAGIGITAALAAVESPAVGLRALTIQREAVYLKATLPPPRSPNRVAAHNDALSVLGPEWFTGTSADLAKFLPMSASVTSPMTATPADRGGAEQPHDEDCRGHVRQGQPARVPQERQPASGQGQGRAGLDRR